MDETKVIASIHVLYNKTLSTHYNTEKIFCFKLMILKNEKVLNILQLKAITQITLIKQLITETKKIHKQR